MLKSKPAFEELKNDYARNFANYSALFYKDFESKTFSTGKHLTLGVPSEELAQAIESLSLELQGLDVSLRGYQEFGIKYLIHQQLTVLGDEMGLGKTIQGLGAIVHLHNTIGATHFLVVAPAGITPNWEKEIRARTRLTPWMLHGPDRNRLTRQWQKSGGIAVISFSSLHKINEAGDVRLHMRLHMIIGDEAHYVKNPNSGRSKAFRKLAENVDYVTLMSGTPMENRPEEFIDVIKALGPYKQSQTSPASKPEQMLKKGAMEFSKAVSKVYLRRNQTDVLHELPAKLETEEWVDLTPQERSIYDRGIVNSAHLMQIRQATTTAIADSAKMTRLRELLKCYEDAGTKVVVFSYFRATLDAISTDNPEHYRIDGSISANERQSIVDTFCSHEGYATLVSQIEAGGVGLNIQAANVVILMEPQFKPTTEWQAIARVFRMGQSRRVLVHRLLATDTIDERLTNRLKLKTKNFDTYARQSLMKKQATSATDCSISPFSTLNSQNLATKPQCLIKKHWL